MTDTDNTKAGARAFFPEGPFMPRVAYAPDDGTGQGGDASAAAAEGDGGNVDPKRDLDQPEKDMYPEHQPGADVNNSDSQGDDGKAKHTPGEGDGDGEDGDGADDKDGDGKDGDGKDKDGEGDDDTKDVDLDAVPEDGKYVVKMPEGMEVDQALLDKVSPIWKEKGLTHKDAQALTDKYIEQQTEAQEAAQAKWDETVAEWGETAKADKEIGGENFSKNLTTAKNVLDQFGTPELKAALDNSGMGSHPEVIRLLVKVGNSVMDDDIPSTNGETRTPAANTSAEAAEELYGDTTPTTRR